ncbi:phage collar protein [Fimbriiglobus ruber]|uniref:Phage protein n=1 Tax=Fimbriiglobus ruber TaxID=1908690 RepID=A0A225EE57_9BACT|nr:hypothetical protein [Fimbriiglobus ruber]OWK47569.1 Phage protein [Fimbriiglobus ruber]
MAFRVLGKQCFQYYAYQFRTPNDVGQYVTTYAPPVTFYGSVQPVPRDLYERYGLELQRSYVNVYLQRNVIDVARDVSGDQIVFNGATYQCVSKTAWDAIDGWDAVLCVLITEPAAC